MMKKTEIRPRIEFLPGDESCIRTVAGWLQAEWADLNPGRTLAQVQRRLKKRSGSRLVPLTLLARDGKALIGTASILSGDMDRRRDLAPWLGAVYVVPEYRGRGVGTALCRQIEAEAVRLNLPRLYLFTEDRETFYIGLGWKVEERCEHRGRQVVVMSKRLRDTRAEP